jgi:diguanylate cyclase (GGDEF)-like protein
MQTHKETLGRLDRLLHNDELTGLPNRAGMLVWLEGRLAVRAVTQTADVKLVVLLFEIDQFGVVNATQGHDAGDELLVQAARRLRECRRDDDLVARVATNGFVVVAGLDAAPVAEALYRQISLAFSAPFDIFGTALRITVSAGAALHPDDASSAACLLAAAELALHAARENGHHQLHFFHPVLNRETQEKVRFGHALRGALEQQQFFLLYQPQVRASDAGVVCMEALIRWSHPTEGTVLPGSFIQIVEEADLIGPLGAWVIDTACRQLADWRALGFGEVRMAVNLSSRQLLAADLQDTIAESIARHQLRAADLELEITESALMRDPERSIAQLDKLRRLGIRLSIDDFGTGYSSLNYIKVLPVHAFKLDRTFVQDIERGGRDLAICETAIRLAHDLGLEVVAEGVEQQAALELLRAMGCDLAQGYLIARPMPLGDLSAYLGERVAEDAGQAVAV